MDMDLVKQGLFGIGLDGNKIVQSLSEKQISKLKEILKNDKWKQYDVLSFLSEVSAFPNE